MRRNPGSMGGSNGHQPGFWIEGLQPSGEGSGIDGRVDQKAGMRPIIPVRRLTLGLLQIALYFVDGKAVQNRSVVKQCATQSPLGGACEFPSPDRKIVCDSLHFRHARSFRNCIEDDGVACRDIA